jgi:hypothetical protein
LCIKRAAGGHHEPAAEHEIKFGTEDDVGVANDQATSAKASFAVAAETAFAHVKITLGAGGQEGAVSVIIQPLEIADEAL